MTITQSSTRLVAVAAGVAVALVLMLGASMPVRAAALSQTQIQSILNLLTSFGADSATINNVSAALNGQPTSGTGGGTVTGGVCPFTWSRSLQTGSTGADVKALQQFLNMSAATMVAASGAGSPGMESTYFGPATKAAVMKFQTANGISAIGLVGPMTRAKLNSLCTTGGSVTPPPPPVTPGTPAPVGSATVSAAAQPANSLAPQGAQRIPYTSFTITNNSSSPVTVNSVTVQRAGLAQDAAFAGVVLLDSNGIQIGNAKTFNSNHQANLDGFTVGVGQSMTYTVVGNMASSLSSYTGQIAQLQIVAINTSAAISGALPIIGASQTLNSSLAIGSFSTTTSAFDPGSATTHNIGDTAIRFTGVRFTASSAEDLKLFNIRWRQVGTASASDIGNIMTCVTNTCYPATVDATGKYYTTVFPGGLAAAKGAAVDVYVKGDLVGSNAASRTVEFDVDKNTDTYFVGQTYGYGVTDTGCAGSQCTNQPWYKGYAVTVNAGTLTTVGKAIEVPAQNIAVNVPNQVLGGFSTEFKGENVSVTSLPITIATSSIGGGAITSISIVDENGNVVAGPKDEASTCTTGCTVTFTDTVTFPTGHHVWTIKGKIPSGTANNSTVVVSTTPSSWSGVTGQTSGNTISISQGNFAMNTMTVKAAALTVTMSTQPSSQNIVAGAQGALLGQVQLDASQSGEDIRLSSLPVKQTGTISELSSCQLWNGTTALNTGSNVPTALAASGSDTTFTFDNVLVVPKGTVVTLGIKCNLGSSASGTHVWAISGNTITATGVTSGSSVSVTATAGSGGTFTALSTGGSMTVTVDASSPSYTPVAAGTTGFPVGVIKLRATNEAITLNKLGLVLTASGNSSSTAVGGTTNSGVSDLVQVYIFDGATVVGTATFTGSGTTATSTLTTPVTLARDTDKLLTVKADLAGIGTSLAGGVGDVIKIDPLNAEGSGQASGLTIKSGATAGVNGVQMFKSYPTVANSGVSCTSSAPVCNGTQQLLKQFKVTANAAGPVGIYQVAVKLATSSATVTNLKLFVLDSSCSSPVSVPTNRAGTSGGQFGGTWLGQQPVESATPTVSFLQSSALQIPANSTYCFQVKGDVAVGSNTSWSVGVTVLGDSATSTQAVGGANVNVASSTTSGVGGRAESFATLGIATTTSQNNFIWSDNASTTANTTTDADWFDGYYIPGLSSSGF